MSQPIGLPNIGATCWLNSCLQTLFHSIVMKDAIQKNTRQAGRLHQLLNDLMDGMDRRDTSIILSLYRELHQYLINSNRDFASSSLNDTNEVITWILNELHREAGKVVTPELRSRLKDASSFVILRDFDNKISNVLEAFVSVISRKTSDNQTLYETFSVLFIDPTTTDAMGNESTSIQAAVSDIHFHNLPKCMFISLVMRPLMRCHVPDVLFAQKTVQLYVRSIVFFLPHMSHYIVAVRGMLDGQPIWCVLNDANISYVQGEQLSQLGIPTLLLYEQPI